MISKEQSALSGVQRSSSTPAQSAGDRQTTASHTRGMRRHQLLAILGATAMLAGAAIVVTFTVYNDTHRAKPRSPTFDARGTLVITDCQPADDAVIAANTSVRITDQNRRTLRQGQLAHPAACEWTFTLAGVPSGKPAYGLAIGASGIKEYTEAELRDGITVTFGAD